MKRAELVKRLSGLGFPLMEVAKEPDVNLALADLVKSRDLRLWEGFPVVMAFSAEKEPFDYKKTESCFSNSLDRLHFDSLMALSLALYKSLGLGFTWADKLQDTLDKGSRRKPDDYLNALKLDQDLRVGKYLLSSRRLNATFNSYFHQQQTGLQDLLSTKEEFGLEQALSQVFSPKQKELFLKKLKQDKLTKTEKEYFSRVVKKKALALANPELHRLSQKLLG